MAKFVCEVLLTESSLRAPRQSATLEIGGVIDFWGIVRRTEDGAALRGIEYEAHPTMAEHQLRVVAEEAATNFGIMEINIQHRIGFVAVGEASLLVHVAAKHRAEAFRAGEWIVSELKKRVPIWKHPRFEAAASGEIGEAKIRAFSRE